MTRPAGRSVLAFLATLAAALLVLELVLRTFFLAPDFKYEDPELGPMNRPHARVAYSQEGFAVHRTNALGFFSPELRRERPRLRVLLLGSSFAEALQVDPDEGFAAVAQSRIDGSEFVNAAQSGWLPAPCLVLLRRISPTIQPDVVVLQVSGVNPFDVRSLRVERDAAGAFGIVPPAPRAGLAERLKASLDGVARHSSLVTMLLQRANQVQADQRLRLRRKFLGEPARGDAAPASPDREGAFRFVLRGMRDVTDRIVVLYVPVLAYRTDRCVTPDGDDAATVRRVASELGVRFVDPTDALCAAYARTRQPLHGFHNALMGEGHLNAAGHRIVGELLARAIESPP